MKRPVGITILGILCLFTGGSGLFITLDRPVIFFGIIHTGIYACTLRMIPNLAGVYVGYGLLKPLRHVWYIYIAGACISIAGLSCNLVHESKIWELHLLLGSQAETIPRVVKFTIETQYLLIAIYLLTAIYVYLQKNYFWGYRDL